MRTYLNVVECAIEYKGSFLIIKRPQAASAGGLLAFPGGKVDEEDEVNHTDILHSAVKREVFEEVGLLLTDPIYYVSSSHFVGNLKVPVIDTIFYCKLISTIPQVTPSPKEVTEYYWMTPLEIDQAPNSPSWLKTYMNLVQSYKTSVELK